MKPLIKVCTPLLATLGVFLLVTHFSPVQAAANSIWFSPGTSQRTTGQSFTVTVYASADPNFGTPGTNVVVKYPGNLVSVTNVTNGGALPSATIAHDPQAQTISLNHSFYGYSSGFTDAPLLRFTVRANQPGKATFDFNQSFVRGHTVAKVPATYTIVSPSCPAGQVGTPPNCSTPAPPPPPPPAPTPSAPATPRPSAPTPVPTTPTPNTSVPSAPNNTAPPETAKAVVIDNVDTQTRYTTSAIRWETTSKPSTSSFKYGTTSGSLDNTSTVTSSDDDLSHEVDLTGLELGTTYFYTIALQDAAGKDISESGEFTTDAYPVTLRLTDNGKPLTNTDVTLKGFSETFTTDDKGEAFTSLMPGEYTLQLTQEGATEEHTFTIKPLEVVDDQAPDTQVIRVEFTTATTALSAAKAPPSLLPIIAAGVGLILLVGGFVGFILWRRHQSALDSSYGYQSILSSDIYSSGPPPGYTTPSEPGIENQAGYTQPYYAPSYTPPAVAPATTAQGIPLAEEEPLDMWSASSVQQFNIPQTHFPSQQAAPTYPPTQASPASSDQIIQYQQAAVATPTVPENPREETLVDQSNTLAIHHQP